MVGLKDLHKLTSGGNYRLQVDLKDFSNNCAVAVYEQFKVRDGFTKKSCAPIWTSFTTFFERQIVDLSDIKK